MNRYSMDLPMAPPYYHSRQLNRVANVCSRKRCPAGSASGDAACKCFHYLTIKSGRVVQMVIYNMGQTSDQFAVGSHHPFHMHGHHFYIIKVGYGNYRDSTGLLMSNNDDLPCNKRGAEWCDNARFSDSSWDRGNLPDMNTRPILKDTVTIPSGGYVVIRFKANNVGWYYAHCHIMLHHMKGMAFAIKIGTDSEIKHHRRPPDYMPHDCGILKPDIRHAVAEEDFPQRVYHPEYESPLEY
jgi:hypothetical protein